ncbi:MAG: hypothetical protein Q4F65_00240 [Propionibacteriaceae bacterium]|nr:hypothetical protein [Propionibacteriaceae bacterium]
MTLAQRVATALTFLLVSGMAATVILTSGRTAAAEREVLSSFDDLGTRAVVVRAEPEAGIDFGVVERLSHMEAVEWIGAFGPARDVQNAATDSGVSVAVRTVHATTLAPLGMEDSLADTCYASPQALESLGLPEVAGHLSAQGDPVCDLGGTLVTPAALSDFEPLVLVAPSEQRSHRGEQVALVVLVVTEPAQVGAVASLVPQVIGPDDPSGISVAASLDIARLRGLVQGQLGGFGRGLTLTLMGVLTLLVGAALFGFVMIRRKDFGRRRALGASRAHVVILVTLNTLMIALPAGVAGACASLLVLLFRGEPLPGPDFVAAVVILATASAGLGALPPSIVAARRDPLTELRVP